MGYLPHLLSFNICRHLFFLYIPQPQAYCVILTHPDKVLLSHKSGTLYLTISLFGGPDVFFHLVVLSRLSIFLLLQGGSLFSDLTNHKAGFILDTFSQCLISLFAFLFTLQHNIVISTSFSVYVLVSFTHGRVYAYVQ